MSRNKEPARRAISTQQARQKAIERFYLEFFLKENNWPHQIEDTNQGPDFLLRIPGGGLVGLELTELLKRVGPSGSLQRQLEEHRDDFMRKLSKAYYSSAGKPAMAYALLPECPTATWLPKLAKRLRMARPAAAGAEKRFKIDFGGPIGTFYIEALPDEFGEYDRWQCVSNSVDYSEGARQELLVETIRKKSAKLSLYAKAVPETILLIYAENTRGSGMFHYTDGPMLPNHGFAEVHLLLYPKKSHRIA